MAWSEIIGQNWSLLYIHKPLYNKADGIFGRDRRFCIPVFWTFLKRLTRQTQRKIFLIVDGHPVHRSVKIRKWLNVHRDHIRLFFLPGYSPELNPDEVLNHDVKTNAVGRRCAHNQSELISHVRGYLHSRQRQPQIVQNYFNEKDVRYAAM